MIICLLFLANKVSGEANRLALRNASDTLILLVELATEAGPEYEEAKGMFVNLLGTYSNQMEGREGHWLLDVPPWWNKNVANELKGVAAHLEKADQSTACKAIEAASRRIALFLIDSKLFAKESVVTFQSEVIPEEIQNDIRNSLDDARQKVERYANGETPTLDDAKVVCMANRKAIVYLYLVRFGCRQIVGQEALKQFRTDINRTIYCNRFLQQTDAVKDGKGKPDSYYSRLEKYSNSETRRLRLLQAIMDNDFEQAQVLLQIALIEAIPEIFNS
jgi:hypothetical protein